MQLTLSKVEMAHLYIHMQGMKKNMKNVLKKNYGKTEGKEHLKTFDGIKDQLKQELIDLEVFEETYISFIDITEKEKLMLSSFLQTYTSKLSEVLKGAKTKNKDDLEELTLLENLRYRVEHDGLEIA